MTEAISTLGRAAGNQVHFLCTTESELPSVGVINMDEAHCQDTGNSFTRINEAWVRDANPVNNLVRSGVATLLNGTVTVASNMVTSKTVVVAGFKTLIGTSAGILTWAVVAGISFTLTSVGATGALVATDNSVVSYVLVESP